MQFHVVPFPTKNDVQGLHNSLSQQQQPKTSREDTDSFSKLKLEKYPHDWFTLLDLYRWIFDGTLSKL